MSKQLTLPHGPLDYVVGSKDLTGVNNVGFGTNDETQRFELGTRALDWDGSVHRYALAAAALTSYQMAVHTTATGGAVSYEALRAASAVGQSVIRISEASITLNQYAGGYILVFHATGGGKVYSITGNTESDGNNVEIYISTPLAVALTTSDAYELWANPWAAMSQANTDGTLAFYGVPQALLTSGYYGWIKTWGPVFIAPQSTVGDAYVKAGYFRHDGSIDARGNVGTFVTDQRAGFTLAGSASGDGPLFMLQVSP